MYNVCGWVVTIIFKWVEMCVRTFMCRTVCVRMCVI
jgi:hypothetical protein